MSYKPSMPERPNPCPRYRPKPKALERPLPEDEPKQEPALSILTFDKMIYRPNTPEEIAQRNIETERRRVAKLATTETPPQKAVVMIAHEYTPPQNPLQQQVVDIMSSMGRGEIDHHEATRQMLEAIAAPIRVRISQIADDYRHQLSEIEERYHYEVAG